MRLLPDPENRTDLGTTTWQNPLHCPGHSVGVQQYLGQKGGPMESGLQDTLWTISTQCDVFWSHKLTSHISKMYGPYFSPVDEQIPGRTIHVHGRHPYCDGGRPKVPLNDSTRSVGSARKGIILPKTHHV